MKQKGYTLLEAIIAMGVMAIAIAAVFYGYIAVANIFTEEMSESDLMIEISKPIEQISQELRNALEIISSSSNSITFWHKDLNGNSSRETDETISYSWSGTPGEDLNKTEGTDTFIVASNVQSFTLTYSGTPDVSFINISITVMKGDEVATLETSAQCRNL